MTIPVMEDCRARRSSVGDGSYSPRRLAPNLKFKEPSLMSNPFTLRNLEPDCLPFLSLLRAGSPPLYRGVNSSNGGITQSIVRRMMT